MDHSGKQTPRSSAFHGTPAAANRSRPATIRRAGASAAVVVGGAAAAIILVGVLVWLFLGWRANALEQKAAARLTELKVFLIKDPDQHITNVNLTPISSPDAQDKLAEVMPLVGQLYALKDLTCEGAALDDSMVAPLSGLKQLTSLTLAKTPITDAGAKNLANLAAVESLFLADTKITPACMESLARIRSVKILDLSGMGDVTSIAPLRKLPDLKHLVLSRCKVSDAALEEAGTFGPLSRLTLNDSQFSEAALAKLREAKPNMTIDLYTSPPAGTDAGSDAASDGSSIDATPIESSPSDESSTE